MHSLLQKISHNLWYSVWYFSPALVLSSQWYQWQTNLISCIHCCKRFLTVSGASVWCFLSCIDLFFTVMPVTDQYHCMHSLLQSYVKGIKVKHLYSTTVLHVISSPRMHWIPYYSLLSLMHWFLLHNGTTDRSVSFHA